MNAFVPSHLTKRIGVFKYVPKEMSHEEMYKNLVCDAEVISIKRFMKKTNNVLTPSTAVAVTFATITLPQLTYTTIPFTSSINIYRLSYNVSSV